MRRIICIGNRYAADDSAGVLVYRHLTEMELPRDVEVIDGALGGLGLLRFIEPAERVVFVDAVWTGGVPGGVVVLAADEVAENAPQTYGHSAGLSYLLGALHSASEWALPDIWVVGIAGVPDSATVTRAAGICLSIAVEGGLAARAHASPARGACA